MHKTSKNQKKKAYAAKFVLQIEEEIDLIDQESYVD